MADIGGEEEFAHPPVDGSRSATVVIFLLKIFENLNLLIFEQVEMFFKINFLDFFRVNSHSHPLNT